MTDEEKLTLIQKYEELPAEEFKEECFEDLKKFAFDKDDTVKTEGSHRDFIAIMS